MAPYQIMSHIECLEVEHVPDWFELVYLIVGDPELLQGICHPLNTLQALDQVPAQGEYPEVPQHLQVLDGADHVGGEGELLVEGAIQFFYRRMESHQLDLRGF